jgi:hypothetical protein
VFEGDKLHHALPLTCDATSPHLGYLVLLAFVVCCFVSYSVGRHRGLR